MLGFFRPMRRALRRVRYNPHTDAIVRRAISMATSDRPVLVEFPPTAPGVAVVALNRPDHLNALNLPMLTALADAFRTLRTDTAVRAIVLTGNGKAFCAGIDLTAAAAIFQGKADVINTDGDPVVQMGKTPCPIIGAINGHAITGGFELALNCDFLVGSPAASFADTHARFGIHPSWGLSQLLPRFVGLGRAKLISLTAQTVDAPTALSWGLLTRVVPAKELLPAATALASAVASNVPELVRLYKPLIDRSQQLGLAEGREAERRQATEYYRSMTPEMFEKMQAFLAGRSRKKV
jgi:enoyl-CoA hydratase